MGRSEKVDQNDDQVRSSFALSNMDRKDSRDSWTCRGTLNQRRGQKVAAVRGRCGFRKTERALSCTDEKLSPRVTVIKSMATKTTKHEANEADFGRTLMLYTD
jgi:hypothetical protein